MDAETFEANNLGGFFGWRQNPNTEDDELEEEKEEANSRHFENPEDENYSPWIDDHEEEDAPKGDVKQFPDFKSSVFPGTTRSWALYTPPEFETLKVRKKKEEVQTFDIIICNDGAEYLNEDGQVKASAVFDALSFTKKIKPVIGIFVNPGVPIVEDAAAKGKTKKSGPLCHALTVPEEERATFLDGKDIALLQRSYEYDTVSDRLVDFYLKDIIPLVEKEIKLDIFLKSGKESGKLNKELFPRGATVCGWDSGGLAAFLLTFHRSDFFQRVMTTCGNFCGWRGAHNVPYLVRTSKCREVKPGHPVRVLMTTSIHDLVSPHGEWLLANETMCAALKYSKYETEFQVGNGGHTLNHAGSIYGKALLWLYEHPDGEFKPDKKDAEGEGEEEEEGEDDEEEDDDE